MKVIPFPAQHRAFAQHKTQNANPTGLYLLLAFSLLYLASVRWVQQNVSTTQSPLKKPLVTVHLSSEPAKGAPR